MKTARPNPKGVLSRRAGASEHSDSLELWPWPKQNSWRLPSGEGLAEFALQAGFVAPLLLAPSSGRLSEADRGRQRAAARRKDAATSAGARK
jgi:hypothetical protein